YTGRNINGESNRLESSGNAEILAASIGPNIVVPIVTAAITENNSVTVNGESNLKSLEDVNLVATTGIGGGLGRATTDGLALSLSLIPYGMEVPDGSSDNSNNNVNISPDALIEAGLNNKSLVHVLPVGDEDELAREGITIGADLTAAQLINLDLDPGLRYVYGEIDLTAIAFDISTGVVIQVADGAHTGHE
ncbi:MAG: hypothetical protein GY917_25065, partial [Planctomycetaceae bacterium]|nr:hypothetical protein [Planctomycetaceae bacterium]